MDLQHMNKDMLIKLIQTCKQDLEEELKRYKNLIKQCEEAKVKIVSCEECNKLMRIEGKSAWISVDVHTFLCHNCKKILCSQCRILLRTPGNIYCCFAFCKSCSSKPLGEGLILDV